MAPSSKLVVLAVSLVGFLVVCNAQVELDHRFLYTREPEDIWLVEFYAPWCGHCKQLEPIYREVYKELRDSPVRVGRVDATRFSDVAMQYDIRGYPTIMFIKGDQHHTMRGDRSKEGILEFVHRALGPPVRPLKSVGKFTEAMKRHNKSVFFLYVGDQDEHADLFQKYKSVAETLLVLAYFYAGEKRILESTPKIQIEREPTILVFKDDRYFEYEAAEDVPTKESVHNWMNGERYVAFPWIPGGSINEMVDVKKYLVLLAVDDEITDPQDVNVRMKEIAGDIALNQRDKYHSDFQFLWMDDIETVNSIALSFLTPPVLLVLEVETHLYFVPMFHPVNATTQLFTQYLDSVTDGSLPAYGGTGFIQGIKRLLFDIISTLVGIWMASRWLFLLMFGIPTVIISVICYSLCCMETVERDRGSDNSDSDTDSNAELFPMPPLVDSADVPKEGEMLHWKDDDAKAGEAGEAGDADPKSIEEKKNE